MTRHQIAVRVRSSYLVKVHRGVYRVGAVSSEHAHEMAALLASGPGALLSHLSAAALWNIYRHPVTAPVHVTVAPVRCVSHTGIRVHRATIARRDVRVRDGIRVSSPPRTLVELGAYLSPRMLEFVVAEANYRGLASDAELCDQLTRNPGKRGTRRLRQVLDLPGGPRRTRSDGERELLRALRRAGIDGYEVNADFYGYEVDFLWRDLDFAVELDGWDGHSGRVAFERDRLKIAILETKGLTVMPVTGKQLRDDVDGVLRRLLQALELKRLKG